MELSIEELKELHAEIKNHKYRQNYENKYADEYRKLLYKLSDNFYHYVKDTKYHASERFIHDFNLYIGNLGRESDKESYKQIREFAIMHTERCIGVIHKFLDDGTVPFYYDTYKDKGGTRHSVKITFNEATGKYEGFVEL